MMVMAAMLNSHAVIEIFHRDQDSGFTPSLAAASRFCLERHL